jgi:ribosomal protein L40E
MGLKYLKKLKTTLMQNKFCESCGNELESGAKFCTKCGTKVLSTSTHHVNPSEEKWWDRLSKVAYIIAYLPLILVLIIVWASSSSEYSSYTRSYTDTTGTAIWYCFLAILIYSVIMRLIKVAFLYITKGLKPNWKGEFKKLF